MKRLYLIGLVCIACFLGGCSDGTAFFTGGRSGNNLLNMSDDIIQPDNAYGLSASFEKDSIVIIESDSETVVKEISIPFDDYQIFLSMTDENNGFLLYCSFPAMGQMMKSLYVTDDRWATYHEKDISSLIDGYPTSLTALSSEHLYIGAQMRSDGYLFETTDSGKNWDAVSIDEGDYRYGYTAISDEDSGVMYVLLEYELSGKGGNYDLYQIDTKQAELEMVGSFSLDDSVHVQEFFMSEGTLYIIDVQGNLYQIGV